MAAILTKKVSDKSGSATGGDWSLALEAIWDEINDNGTGRGGTIDFDEETITLKTSNTWSFGVPLFFESNLASRIRPLAGTGVTLMNFANQPFFGMDRLLFVGDGDATDPRSTDCGALLYVGYINQVSIKRCFFVGIKVAGNLLEVGNGARCEISETDFSGSAGVLVKVNQGYVLDMKNCRFIDYFGIYDNVEPTYHDKSGSGVSWIQCISPPPGVVGERQPVLSFKNITLDEASQVGIYIEDYPTAFLENCRVNISSSGLAKGFHFKDMQQVTMRHCHVGYNLVDKPMVKLENVASCKIIGMTRDNNVNAPYRIECDSASRPGLELLDCDANIVIDEV